MKKLPAQKKVAKAAGKKAVKAAAETTPAKVKLPGLNKFSDITLKRGVTANLRPAKTAIKKATPKKLPGKRKPTVLTLVTSKPTAVKKAGNKKKNK